jgi:hypothetical protein
MGIIPIIVGGLITWRLSNMLIKQNGPLYVFTRLRAFLAAKRKVTGGLYDILTCMSCVSMLFGAVTALWVSESLFTWLAYTLTFSAIATLLEALWERKS